MSHADSQPGRRTRPSWIAEVAPLLPLLAVYVAIVVLFAAPDLQGDEGRYLMFAENLTRGFYSPSDSVNLWNGPGYPLVLAPFVAVGAPLIVPRLANAVFFFLAVAYLYAALRLYLPRSRALFAAYLFGLYPPSLTSLRFILTETLAVFLVCGFIYHLARVFKERKRGHLLLAGFYLGYLALTKIFFGYVIAVLLALAVVLALASAARRRGNSAGARAVLQICVVALIVCAPYLTYTYSLTGKVFYWSNAGGSSLYWMSDPYWDELGDWHTNRAVFDEPALEEHEQFFTELRSLDSIQQDDLLKKKAVENILRSPKKFLYNWGSNIGRLLLNYPYSHTEQKPTTFFYMIPNMFLVVPFFLSLYPALKRRRTLPRELPWLLMFAVIALAGSSLLSAYAWQFVPVVPVLVWWIAVIAHRFVAVVHEPA